MKVASEEKSVSVSVSVEKSMVGMWGSILFLQILIKCVSVLASLKSHHHYKRLAQPLLKILTSIIVAKTYSVALVF